LTSIVHLTTQRSVALQYHTIQYSTAYSVSKSIDLLNSILYSIAAYFDPTCVMQLSSSSSNMYSCASATYLSTLRGTRILTMISSADRESTGERIG
jgi:hypothetical protein